VIIGGAAAFALTRGGGDDSSDDHDEPQTTLPKDSADTTTDAPEAATLPPGETLPGGITLPPLTLPPGVTLPDDLTLPPDLTVPEGDTAPDETSAPDDTESPDEATTVAPVGDLVPLGKAADLGEGFTVTVNSFTEDDTEALTSNPANPAPSAGNVYSVVNVTIEYDGDPNFGYVALLDFTALRPPDVEANWYETIYLTPDDPLPLADSIAPGDSVTGNIVFEIPKDATGDVSLRAANLVSFDSEGVDFALH